MHLHGQPGWGAALTPLSADGMIVAADATLLVGERVKQIRQRRGWTAAQLAERCKAIGAPEITVAVIANIETGRKDKAGRRRREVTVDELFALAYALQVSPVLLMVPLDGADQLAVTPEVDMDVLTAVGWVAGTDVFRDVFGPDTVGADPAAPVAAAQRRQDMRPLALLREITAALLRAEVIRQMRAQPGSPTDPATPIPEIGQEIALRSEWLESLGLTPPPVPEDLAELVRAAPGGELPSAEE